MGYIMTMIERSAPRGINTQIGGVVGTGVVVPTTSSIMGEGARVESPRLGQRTPRRRLDRVIPNSRNLSRKDRNMISDAILGVEGTPPIEPPRTNKTESGSDDDDLTPLLRYLHLQEIKRMEQEILAHDGDFTQWHSEISRQMNLPGLSFRTKAKIHALSHRLLTIGSRYKDVSTTAEKAGADVPIGEMDLPHLHGLYGNISPDYFATFEKKTALAVWALRRMREEGEIFRQLVEVAEIRVDFDHDRYDNTRTLRVFPYIAVPINGATIEDLASPGYLGERRTAIDIATTLFKAIEYLNNYEAIEEDVLRMCGAYDRSDPVQVAQLKRNLEVFVPKYRALAQQAAEGGVVSESMVADYPVACAKAISDACRGTLVFFAKSNGAQNGSPSKDKGKAWDKRMQKVADNLQKNIAFFRATVRREFFEGGDGQLLDHIIRHAGEPGSDEFDDAVLLLLRPHDKFDIQKLYRSARERVLEGGEVGQFFESMRNALGTHWVENGYLTRADFTDLIQFKAPDRDSSAAVDHAANAGMLDDIGKYTSIRNAIRPHPIGSKRGFLSGVISSNHPDVVTEDYDPNSAFRVAVTLTYLATAETDERRLTIYYDASKGTIDWSLLNQMTDAEKADYGRILSHVISERKIEEQRKFQARAEAKNCTVGSSPSGIKTKRHPYDPRVHDWRRDLKSAPEVKVTTQADVVLSEAPKDIKMRIDYKAADLEEMLESFPPDISKRIADAIHAFNGQDESGQMVDGGQRKTVGFKPIRAREFPHRAFFRLRIGGYRVVLELNKEQSQEGEMVLSLFGIGKKRSSYKGYGFSS